MRRGRVALTALIGLAVFLVVLALYLPAGWFASALPRGVRCGELGGSVWEGECIGLELAGAQVGDATWNLAALRGFTGRLVGDVEVRGARMQARADIDLTTGGDGTLSALSAQLPLDPNFVPMMPRDYRGTLNADLKHVLLAGGAPRQIAGTLVLSDLVQVAPQRMALGTYEVTFDGVVQPDGKVLGHLRDLSGPFIVAATVALTPPNTYAVDGYITGRTADAERIVREITFYAQPDASGRSPLKFDGSY